MLQALQSVHVMQERPKNKPTSLQSFEQSQSSDSSPFHLKAPQESPSEDRSPRQLPKHSKPTSIISHKASNHLCIWSLHTFTKIHGTETIRFPLPAESLVHVRHPIIITGRQTGPLEHLSSPGHPAFRQLKAQHRSDVS